MLVWAADWERPLGWPGLGQNRSRDYLHPGARGECGRDGPLATHSNLTSSIIQRALGLSWAHDRQALLRLGDSCANEFCDVSGSDAGCSFRVVPLKGRGLYLVSSPFCRLEGWRHSWSNSGNWDCKTETACREWQKVKRASVPNTIGPMWLVMNYLPNAVTRGRNMS